MNVIQQWLLVLALLFLVVAANIWFYTEAIPQMAGCR